MKTNKRYTQGFMLISSLFLMTVLSGYAFLLFYRVVNEIKSVEREVDRVRAYCAAEAGLQGALSEVAFNSYTGFLTAEDFGPRVLSIDDHQIGVAHATKTIVDDSTVIVQAVGEGIYTERALEAYVKLESIFSKYFVFCDAESFASGSGAQYSVPIRDPDTGEIVYDEDGRPRVAPDDFSRALLYFRGDWEIAGTDVRLFGNAYMEGDLVISAQQNSLDAVGDLYIGDQIIRQGALTVDDTYADGVDEHPMTSNEIEGPFPTLDANFYQAHNSIPVFGSSPGSRIIEFVPAADGTSTIVNEYNNTNYNSLIQSYPLPQNAIIYVDGELWLKGSIAGKVTVYASDDIHIQDSLTYNNNLNHADATHSAAFLANDILYFNHPDMTCEGIFYAGRISNAGHAQDASRTLDGELDLGGKICVIVNGNRIMKGSSYMAHYAHRLYTYDPYLRKNPPPGLPVTTVMANVREIMIPE